MIKPTIGRVVWYRPSEWDKSGPGALVAAQGQPLDAHIVFVHGDKMINVAGFDANGVPFRRCSVTLLQDDDAAPAGSAFAEWMPYQAAQAAKSV